MRDIIKRVGFALVVIGLLVGLILPIASCNSIKEIGGQSLTSQNETCQEYLERRLSEGWEILSQDGYNVILMSPDGVIRELDLRNDVETLRPNATGDENSIPLDSPSIPDANHWQHVDEVIADDTTTMVYNNTTTYQRDLYNLPASSGLGTINSVKIYFRIGMSGAYTVYGKPSQKSGITVTDGTQVSRGEGWETFSQTYTDNPATGSAYSWAEIDALQIGVQLKSGTGGAGALFTQVYIEVDYTIVPPTVTTQAVSDITDTTATGNGNITDIGSENCDKRGIVYGTTSKGDPGAAAPPGGYDDYEEESPGPFGTGAFTRSLTGLTPVETYYARAYAHNSGGYNYGDEVSFTTLGPPSVTTSAASLVEETTATLNGEITAINGANATTRGFEWDIDTGAPYANDWHQDGTYGVEAFTRALSSLTKGELYYYRAYATNTYGTGYGAEQTFLTKPDPPNTLAATSDSTQIDLTWVKPASADKTYIRGEDGSYPDDRADGYLVYNDTLELTTDAGLTGGHTYYYKAWSWCTEGGKTQFSDNYDSAFATPGLTLILHYQPITIVENTNHAGTADAGSDDDTIIDDTLTQANDYWIGALVTITDTGDGAPDGETSVCSAYALATTEITVSPAFTVGVDADDTYTIDFGTMADEEVSSGTADDGSTTTLVDAVLTQANDYWNNMTLDILTTTDGLAPQGENAIITDFTAVDDTLTFAALTVAVGDGDTYELRNDGKITWGANPTGVAVSVGALLPEIVVPPVTGAADVPDLTPEFNPSVSSGAEGENFLFYDLFHDLMEDFRTSGGVEITMPYFWKIVASVLAFLLGTAVLMATRNILVGIGAYALSIAVPTAMGILDWYYIVWYVVGAVAVSLLITKWTSSSI